MLSLYFAGEALNVAEGQDEYLAKMTTPASAASQALGKATATAPWDELHKAGKTMFRFSNAWTTDVVEAKTLAMFAYMMRAQRVMEIGMFTGYGALTIAEVLPEGGKMISCEIDPFLAEFSKPFFDQSPHGSKVDVRIGAALETMKAYDAAKEGGGVDMIFIDADKGGYAAYYEAALSTPGLLAEGGVIVVDNTLFKGQAWLPRQDASRDYLSWNDGGTAIAIFNELVAADERVEQVILPIRDGITIVRRKGGVQPRAATAVAVPSVTLPPPPVPATPSTAVAAKADAVMTGVAGKKILDRMRLDGKVALVTGGGQGIGRAFAHALCEAGAALLVVDLDVERAETVVAELAAKGGKALAYQANVGGRGGVGAGHGRVCDTAARWAAHRREQRRHQQELGRRGHAHGRVRRHVQCQHAWRLHVLPARGTSHAQARWRQDHQHGVDGLAHRAAPAEAGGVQRLQERGRQAHPVARLRVGRARCQRQLHVAWHRRHAADLGQPGPQAACREVGSGHADRTAVQRY